MLVTANARAVAHGCQTNLREPSLFALSAMAIPVNRRSITHAMAGIASLKPTARSGKAPPVDVHPRLSHLSGRCASNFEPPPITLRSQYGGNSGLKKEPPAQFSMHTPAPFSAHINSHQFSLNRTVATGRKWSFTAITPDSLFATLGSCGGTQVLPAAILRPTPPQPSSKTSPARRSTPAGRRTATCGCPWGTAAVGRAAVSLPSRPCRPGPWCRSGRR